MKYYNIVDLVQWVWLKSFNMNVSRSKIKKDLAQGAISLNGQKLTIDTIIRIEDGQ